MNQQTTNRDTGEAAATNAPANSATSTSTPDNQPTPLDAFEVLLITGMSGAGRSHAADCVEDMGWYVVDNLPPKLLIPLVDMMTTSGSGSESGVHKLAAVIDVRSSYFDELAAVLGHLDDLGVKPVFCSSTPATKCSSSAMNPCAARTRCSTATD